MSQELIEKHEILVGEIANVYRNNMELELGKKYKNKRYKINPNLTDTQNNELKTKHPISQTEYASLYSAFQELKPTEHLKKVMDAFTGSGGNVDIEPQYNENTKKLNVSVTFVIKGNTLEKIEGLSRIENFILKLNAMLQVDETLSTHSTDSSF